jgi:hypothetical protein
MSGIGVESDLQSGDRRALKRASLRPERGVAL